MSNIISFTKKTLQKIQIKPLVMDPENNLLNIRHSIQFIDPRSIDWDIDQLNKEYDRVIACLEGTFKDPDAETKYFNLLESMDDFMEDQLKSTGQMGIVTTAETFVSEEGTYRLSIVQIGFARYIRFIGKVVS